MNTLIKTLVKKIITWCSTKIIKELFQDKIKEFCKKIFEVVIKYVKENYIKIIIVFCIVTIAVVAFIFSNKYNYTRGYQQCDDNWNGTIIECTKQLNELDRQCTELSRQNRELQQRFENTIEQYVNLEQRLNTTTSRYESFKSELATTIDGQCDSIQELRTTLSRLRELITK